MTKEQELLKAIRAMCLSCSGGSRTQVRQCPIRYCPLYDYRQGEAKPKGEIAGQMKMDFGRENDEC